MDLQGIGSVAAAAIALIGVSSTMVMGRWQLRAGLRAADATARAGLAQADASYSAALDAVRAQGQIEHVQWRRGIQREAYASFLQAVLSHHDYALNLEPSVEEEETRLRIAGLKPLAADMSHKGWVVRLEGPEEVASAARVLQTSAEVLAIMMQNHTRQRSAMEQVAARTNTHRQDANRAWELITIAQGAWHTIGTPENSTVEVLAELRQLFARLGLSTALIPALCGPADDGPDLNLPSFDEASSAFLLAARAALHPR
ncbi:hypothetical protein OG742_10275 [Streptomyces sp. NBC_00828]|uniref:hypothetical protein n=1 Tax=Streptomyces sp. NBC_00828 TaxID=2903678 RepID=UPI003870C607